jgi:type VI secretion system protein ImpH
MGTPSWRAEPSLEQALFNRSSEFEFFQAVRLLAKVLPKRKQVGSAAQPGDETVRFVTRISLSFPPSTVEEISRPDDTAESVRMVIAFMGLAGLQGVLPLYYTERILERIVAKDKTIAAFFDLFNHRFISLFYRAWEKHRPTVLYESATHNSNQCDLFTHSLFDLIGMGTGSLRGRMSIDDEGLLLYAGLIAQRPHSVIALRGILRDFFRVPIEIDQCLGGWHELADQDRCYLAPALERSQLGEGAFLGEEVWDQQARFRIQVGPVGLERFRNFLPGQRELEELVELTKYFVGAAYIFDVQVALLAPEVPYCRLGDEGQDAPRLGWMGWLKTEEFHAPAADSVFTYTA